ncbi:hypothetical protein KM031_02065 [Gemmobacter fulvus]|uniref:Uncharacterized protein n=1 Tax=Gemmobacter fulvus TaxID=2840474 RepID=A0A975P8F4_9RHOB|nr:hypothetical protein [Gemmobacter fulvus]MBT9244925.1 hypothetical protein [Gemmobacter fulvus]QWK90721.1 hypothetical protein KM031_02065 [Gemmobacter fulvus]
MEVKSVGVIPLSDKKSGCYLTDVEKVAIAALAMGTTNAGAINSLTGLKKNDIKTLLCILEENGWDMHNAIARVCVERQHNLTYNQDAYPILRMKGVVA